MLTGQLWNVLTVDARREEAIKKIDQFDPSMVKSDVVARQELEKFFQVAAVRQQENKKTGMPACYLDTFWHQFLEKPVEYARICTEAVGAPVDHIPYNGEGPWEWISDYESMFGSLSPIWFTDLDGIFNGPMYMEYVETGIVKASWNCSPLLKPSEKKLMSCIL